jgi:hypothetical protein
VDSRPIYTCYRADSPIIVDGRLDEPCWRAAEPISLVRTDTGEPPRFPTTVKLLWDDRFLYAGFHCIDPDIWGTITERDGPMYEEEVVEVFIDANRDGISYVELEVNPLNVALDLYMLNRQGRRWGLFDWDSADWQHAVTVDGYLNQRDRGDRSWTVEMAIPLADLATAPHIPPLNGDVWRVNLYRIDRGTYGDEYSAWSPTWEINYHISSRFGEVVFCDQPVSGRDWQVF